MTNGEKLKEIFPNIDNRLDTKTGIMIVKWADNTTKFFKTSWWNAEYKEPSSSGKPNKSIEEKCPCYYCEHFEIKGLSHCKIHEDAYGDSRCNDYHKINQKPNKSEIPTGSNDCISREQALDLLCKKCPVYDCISKCSSYRAVKKMPSVTPQEPRKGHWVLTDVEGNKVWHCHCSECGKDPQDYVGGSENWWLIKSKLPKFCPSCGSDNREVEE